jgi:hypothetical protein
MNLLDSFDHLSIEAHNLFFVFTQVEMLFPKKDEVGTTPP